MIEEEVIRFKRAYLQMKIDSMNDYIKKYKRSVDKCDPAGISSAAMSIGKLEYLLTNDKQYLSMLQENEIDDLDREFADQFQRLSAGKVCECKQR
jgi:hypothetical protein